MNYNSSLLPGPQTFNDKGLYVISHVGTFSLSSILLVGLCGTKLGCGEGGCGACTVMISKIDNSRNKIMYPLYPIH